MRATNQGGSLAGFIIIGVLLALVLIGGLYGLNRYNAQRTADETVQQEEEKTKPSGTSTEVSPTEDTAKPNTADSATKTETDQSRTNNAPATPAPTPAPSTANSSSSQLPQTGPADTLLSLIAVGALAFAGVHYARSRS